VVDPTGATQSQINLGSDAGGPVIIRNLAAGVLPTDAANYGQVQAVAAVAGNSVQYGTNPNGTRSNTIALQGGSPGAVTIQNVAAGVNPTDAVNVSQLGVANKSLSNLAAFSQNGIDDLQNQVNKNKKAANAGTSLALAASGLRYGDKAGKTSVAAAMGYYKGQTGLAAGIAHTSENNKWRFNAALTLAPSQKKPDIGVVAGASYLFD
jgi:autotransporter adhesin